MFLFTAGNDEVTGKRRQASKSGFRTKAEAWTACREAMESATTGAPLLKREIDVAAAAARVETDRQLAATASRLTVGTYLAGVWLPAKVNYRPNTHDMHDVNIRVHITPAIGGIALEDLTNRDVFRMLQGIATISPKTGKIRSLATIARVRATLSKALDDAVFTHHLLHLNVARGVRLPDVAEVEARELQVFTPKDQVEFLLTADSNRLGMLYRLMLSTGMRRGELVGLRWSDVELNATPARLFVRQNITQRGGQLRYGKPKTKRGERLVALDAGTVERLRRHRAAQSVERLAAGSAWQDENLVFSRQDGTPVRPDYVTRLMGRLCTAAGVPVIRLHDGRHTHASTALAAGVDAKIVADRLGHSTTTITRDLYQHVLPDVAAAAAEQIAAVGHRAEAERGRQLPR